MTKTKGSKSAPTPKSTKTPAQVGPPELTVDSGTTVVLPNPADAPAPPKAGKKKPEPTVAAKGEVPDWAKRAAARDTVAEMAKVPEPAPVATAAEAASDSPSLKKGRAAKATKPPRVTPASTVTPAAPPGSLRAIGTTWIETLRKAGHSVSTVSSYTNDIELAYEFLGGDTPAAALTEKQIAAFNASKSVVKKRNGKARAQPTILKTRRVLRLALTWAEEKGLIKKAPFAAKTPA